MLTPKFLEISERSKKLRGVSETSPWNCCSVNGYVYITLLFSLLGRRLCWNFDMCSWTAECETRSRAGNAAAGVQTYRDFVTCFASLPCTNLINTCLFTCMSLECIQRIYVWHESQTGTLTLSDPTSNLIRQNDFSYSAPMSEDVRHVFCCVRPLSEPVRRFSSCTEFSQQIAQAVLFLFLHVFLL
jgi:hypothetical protein